MSIGRGNEAAEDDNTRTTRMNDDEISDSNALAAEETQATDSNTPAGHWRKGMQSPNKAGRPRNPRNIAELRELAREKTGAMLEFLSRTALNPKVSINVRVAACTEVLNRGWGRAPQSLDVNHGTQSDLEQILDELSGRYPIKTNEGTVSRPALANEQPLHNLGEGRTEDFVPPELGSTKTPR